MAPSQSVKTVQENIALLVTTVDRQWVKERSSHGLHPGRQARRYGIVDHRRQISEHKVPHQLRVIDSDLLERLVAPTANVDNGTEVAV